MYKPKCKVQQCKCHYKCTIAWSLVTQWGNIVGDIVNRKSEIAVFIFIFSLCRNNIWIHMNIIHSRKCCFIRLPPQLHWVSTWLKKWAKSEIFVFVFIFWMLQQELFKLFFPPHMIVLLLLLLHKFMWNLENWACLFGLFWGFFYNKWRKAVVRR